MEGLLWLLGFGVLFYFMMRHGCGAHVVHGRHGGHEGHGGGGSDKDPVCGNGWYFALVWAPLYNFFAARSRT